MWVDYGWIKAIYGWFVCGPGGEVTIRGRDHRHPSRWESLNNQLASHTGVSLENQSGPSCHISKPVCKLHRCQLELATTLGVSHKDGPLVTGQSGVRHSACVGAKCRTT